jgi:hypothetical protein
MNELLEMKNDGRCVATLVEPSYQEMTCPGSMVMEHLYEFAVQGSNRTSVDCCDG